MAYSEAAYRAAKKYKAENIKRIPLETSKTLYEELKAHADARGERVNSFIKRAIRETMDRDKEEAGD